MDSFDLDRRLLADYERFARSFTRIRADDIGSQIESIYAEGRFRPEPLISINPHYEVPASTGSHEVPASTGSRPRDCSVQRLRASSG